MDNDRFDLVFKGELVPGAELAQVKQNLQQLFKIDEEQVDKLFTGSAIVLKRNLDADAANKYRVALKRAGARLQVSAAQPGPPVAAAPETARAASTAAGPAAAGGDHKTPATAPAATAAVSGTSTSERPKGDWRRTIAAPDFGLAAPGADLLRDDEKPPAPSVQLDLSGLSVAPMLGDLVAEHERLRAVPVEVNIPALDVLPVGSDVLAESERPMQAAVQVDTSGLSVAEPGARLSEPAGPAPAAPDVNHIRLQD